MVTCRLPLRRTRCYSGRDKATWYGEVRGRGRKERTRQRHQKKTGKGPDRISNRVGQANQTLYREGFQSGMGQGENGDGTDKEEGRKEGRKEEGHKERTKDIKKERQKDINKRSE